jgi:hypothetical protein
MAKKKEDKRVNNGGKRESTGRKPIPEQEKKKTLSFYVKSKHIETARKLIQPIVDKLNKK